MGSGFFGLPLKTKLILILIWFVGFVVVQYFVFSYIDCTKSFWDFWYLPLTFYFKCDLGIMSFL